MVTIKPQQYEELLRKFLTIPVSNPNAPLRGLLIIGAAGIGKTTIAKQIASELDFHISEVFFGNMADPGDARGLPIQKDGSTGWLISEEFKIPEGQPTVLLLDEITRAPVYLHSLIATLMTSNSIAPGHYLDPRYVRVVATGNPWTDESYSVNELDLAIRSRFTTYELAADWNQWYGWVIRQIQAFEDENRKQRAADLAAIVVNTPELVSDEKNPRSWWWAIEEASCVDFQDPIFALLLDGRISGASGVVMGMLEKGTSIPTRSDMYKDPEGSAARIEELPTELQSWGIRRVAAVAVEDPDEERLDPLYAKLFVSDKLTPELLEAFIDLLPPTIRSRITQKDVSILRKLSEISLEWQEKMRSWLEGMEE